MRLRLKQKLNILLVRFSPLLLLSVCGVALWLISVYYGLQPEDMICHLIRRPCSDPVDFHREIAFQLKEITEELQWTAAHKKPINPHIHLQIGKILMQLDPRLAASYSYPATTVGDVLGTNSNSTQLIDVCPEVYMGARYSYPFQQDGFLTEDCGTAKPLHDVITIVISTADYSEEHIKRLQYVLNGINTTYPSISVLLGTTSKLVKDLARNYPNVRLVEQTESYSVGKAWNVLLRDVKTPYVLLARDIAHFNSYAKLERQIRVISLVPHVQVAGGTFRNMSGHWFDGCYQSSIRNYFLQYRAGYEISTHECMFCDYLEGPFMAKTKIFATYAFSEHLPASVILANWFLQIKDANHLVLNCPDVMYFTWENRVEENKKRKDWQELGKWWEVNKIFFPPNILHIYTCDEVAFSCDIQKLAKSYLIPPCCSLQYSQSLAFLEEFSSQRGLPYELEAGSTLGAVKIHDFIPWDLDGDITFHTANYTTFKKAADLFKSKGFKLSNFQDPVSKPGKNTNGYFNIYTPDIYLEMWGYPKFSTDYLPADLRHIPTKVSVRGVWVRTQSNPGLYARNRYGYNYLRHAQFWGYTGMSNSWESYDAGKWKKCPRPSHHACLDRYPVDGNMDFIPDNYP